MKQLVTVTWSATVSVDIPENIKPESLIDCDCGAPEEVQKVAVNALKNAYDNIGWHDGTITDVQNEEEDEPLTQEDIDELKEILAEQKRRDEKNGLYSEREDIAN